MNWFLLFPSILISVLSFLQLLSFLTDPNLVGTEIVRGDVYFFSSFTAWQKKF